MPTTTTISKQIEQQAQDAYQEAADTYNSRYDNTLYLAATQPYARVLGEELDSTRANELIDSALALLGSPPHRYVCHQWTPAEAAFLAHMTAIPPAVDEDTCQVDWADSQGDWFPHHNRGGGLEFSRLEANTAAWLLSRGCLAARITQGGRILAVFAANDPLFAGRG